MTIMCSVFKVAIPASRELQDTPVHHIQCDHSSLRPSTGPAEPVKMHLFEVTETLVSDLSVMTWSPRGSPLHPDSGSPSGSIHTRRCSRRWLASWRTTETLLSNPANLWSIGAAILTWRWVCGRSRLYPGGCGSSASGWLWGGSW